MFLQFAPLGKEDWTLNNSRGSVTIPLSGQVVINDVGVIRSMALEGEGVALLPRYLCRRNCETGQLVRVLPDWHAKADESHRLPAPALHATQAACIRRSRLGRTAQLAGDSLRRNSGAKKTSHLEKRVDWRVRMPCRIPHGMDFVADDG